MRDRKFNNALKLFHDEQDALRNGQMELVGKIGEQKDAMIADLAAMKLTREQAVRLKEQADRSAKLLTAAINGVKDAQARLAALSNIQSGLSVYTATGERETVARQHTGLHHKV